MRKESYAELINSSKVMLSGLSMNTDKLSKRGIDEQFVQDFERVQKSAMDLDNEQEDLKAKLKTKTAELEDNITELKKMLSEAKKLVKLEMSQEAWKTFGIEDKR